MSNDRAAVMREILQQLDDDVALKNEMWEEAYQKDQEHEDYINMVWGDEY